MLRLEDLSVYYGVIPAVRDISIEVGDGSIVAILGANGAGKSTILKTIAGILKPKKGKIVFMDNDITKKPAHDRVKMGIVLVPEGRMIFSRLTVKENLILGAYYLKQDISETLEWIYQNFPILKERESQLAGTLSGGEQQMLAIARGLMAQPKLMLLDEPSLGLAPKIVNDLYRHIKRINEEGVTILLVEQNVYKALSIADYVYILQSGNIVFEGTPDEMERERVHEAYLGGVT